MELLLYVSHLSGLPRHPPRPIYYIPVSVLLSPRPIKDFAADFYIDRLKEQVQGLYQLAVEEIVLD